MNREDANANKKIESKHGTIPTNIVAYRDKEGKLQTSLPIQQSTLTKSKSLSSKISRRIHRFLPIIDWLPNYDVKKNILGDIVGGLTIGVLHTTQGIAYALLARVQPVYGLYTSFFPALIYAIFGTSRHASVGSFAIVALMCGMAVDRVMMNDQMQRSQNETLGMDANDTKNIAVPEYSAIEIASTIFTMQGIILLVAAICGLQFITKYFSDTLVSGFTTGAAVHVAVGQIKVVLGLNIKAVGNRHILKRISDIVMNIPNANICVVITSVCSMLFIYIGKEFIDPRVKRYSKAIQIPYELILIISGTLVSYTMKLRDVFHVRCVGEIPVGLPKPRLPRFELMPECLPDALAIAALSIAIHISMSKMLAKKLKYKIDAGQELYAYGLMGTISGLFLCYPSSTSMGRTLVSVASGSQTQIASLISCIFMMGIILFFGPLFYTLPMCILASIILMALRKMFKKWDELKYLWRLSKIDLLIWVIAFTSTVFIGVIYGLAISMAFALVSVVVRTYMPSRFDSTVNDNRAVIKTVEVDCSQKDTSWHTASDTIYYRFSFALSFATVDKFKDSFQKTYVQWSELRATRVDSVEQLDSIYLVFDFEAMKFIDTSGISSIKEIIAEMEKHKIKILFVNVNARVTKMLQLSNLSQYFHSAIRV